MRTFGSSSAWPCRAFPAPRRTPPGALATPGKITIRDWIWGPGGEARAPKAPFEFIEEDLNGTNPKIKVRDARGDHWIVKFGGENHGEVFASRLLLPWDM